MHAAQRSYRAEQGQAPLFERGCLTCCRATWAVAGRARRQLSIFFKRSSNCSSVSEVSGLMSPKMVALLLTFLSFLPYWVMALRTRPANLHTGSAKNQ